MPDTLTGATVDELVGGVSTGRPHTILAPYTSPDPTAFSNPPAGAQYRVTATTATGQTITGISVPLSAGSPGALDWLKYSTSLSAGAQATIRGVAKDSAGNIVVCGLFSGTMDFGAGAVTSSGGAAFIAKYTPAGALIFSKKLTVNDLGSGAYSVAVDSQANIIVVGVFSHVMDFGGGTTLTSTLDAFGSDWGDFFVAKYTTDGTLSWANRYGGTNQDICFGVAIDPSNNILLGTMIQNTVTFGGITLNAGYDDIAIVKLSSSGTVLWAKLMTGAGDDRPFGINVDSSGNLLVTGVLSDGANIGGGPITGAGMFLAKYSGTDGSYLWSKTFSGGIGWSVAADPVSGNVIFSGSMAGPTNFGGGNVGPGGLFLAVYNSSGTYQWAKCFNVSSAGYSTNDAGYGIVVDGSGNIFFAGQVGASPISFDGAKGWYGSVNNFVASFTSAGTFRWGQRAGGSGNGIARAVALDNAGHVITGGQFQGQTIFDKTSVIAPGGATLSFLAAWYR